MTPEQERLYGVPPLVPPHELEDDAAFFAELLRRWNARIAIKHAVADMLERIRDRERRAMEKELRKARR